MDASDRTGGELNALIASLTEDEMRLMLTYLAGYTRPGFDWALARVRPS